MRGLDLAPASRLRQAQTAIFFGVSYTLRMSSIDPSPSVDSRGRKHGRFGRFWQQISEGRELHELWSQFRADAQASYGFYIKDTNEEELSKHRGLGRWYRTSKALFW